MKCPFCNSEMKQGWLMSNRRILWSPKKDKSFMIKGKNDISPRGSTALGANILTYCCEDCKKMVIM